MVPAWQWTNTSFDSSFAESNLNVNTVMIVVTPTEKGMRYFKVRSNANVNLILDFDVKVVHCFVIYKEIFL